MTEAEYMADVQRRGGWYVRSLFKGAWPLRDTVAGFPGAGFVDAASPAAGARYELAPFTVAAHVLGWQALVLFPLDQTNAARSAGDVAAKEATDVVQQTVGQVPNVLGNVLGLPPIVVTLLVLVIGYAALQQAGFVPPIKKVFR